MPRHLKQLLDLSAEQLRRMLDRAHALRGGAKPKQFPGHILGLVFEKPSTRTRVSFEVAAHKLGAGHLFISTQDSQLGRGEPAQDNARVLGRYLDAIALRTFDQATVETYAAFAGVPVLNALSNNFHPCQALADLATLEQVLNQQHATMAYFGDGNNVFASLAEAATLYNLHLRFCGPAEYDPDPILLAQLLTKGANIEIIRDPYEAIAGVDAVYTDVWTSMGQETEAKERLQKLAPYQVNETLMATNSKAIILHCLPAHRGEEITAPVLESKQSHIFTQAENRLWVQMAILEAFWQEI